MESSKTTKECFVKLRNLSSETIQLFTKDTVEREFDQAVSTLLKSEKIFSYSLGIAILLNVVDRVI